MAVRKLSAISADAAFHQLLSRGLLLGGWWRQHLQAALGPCENLQRSMLMFEFVSIG